MPQQEDWIAIKGYLDQAASPLEFESPITEDGWIVSRHRHDTFLARVEAFQQTSERKNIHLNDHDLTLACAMIAFGPEHDGLPPDAVWEHIGLLARDHLLPDAPAHFLMDLVLAYGCGWPDGSRHISDFWTGQWSQAVFNISSMVARSISKTIDRLKQMLGSKNKLADIDKTEIYLLAQGIGLEIIRNQSKRGQYRLISWQPTTCALWHFLADAVAGCGHEMQAGQEPTTDRSRKLQGGAFATSLLYPQLHELTELIVGSVEFKICHECHGDVIHQAVTTGKRPTLTGLTSLYQNNHCPSSQDHREDCKKTYYTRRKNWILIPYEHGGTYEIRQRWACPQCGNLFTYTKFRAEIEELQQNIKRIRKDKDFKRWVQQLQEQYLPDDPFWKAFNDKMRDRPAYVAQMEQELAELQRMQADVVCPLCGHAPPQRPTKIWVDCYPERTIIDRQEP
ncbi:MAG: hypothetical protein HC837_17150 [Chloroflexaceae bacterium]|nr:hypothetical protein [Chloroflexaceae bacterium]